MKYLQVYEKFKMVDYHLDNDLLNLILNKVAEPFHGIKCYINNYQFEPTNPFWFTCKFRAKSGIEASNNIQYYTVFLKEKKEQLEKMPEIENVKFTYKGRFEPLKPDGKYGNWARAGQSIFEVEIYLKEEIFDEIRLEYEYHQNAKKYNL